MAVPEGALTRIVSESSRGYYGWWIVGTAFITLFFVFGAPTFMMPIIYDSVIDEFGWSRSQATLVASWKFFSAAVFALVVGSLIEWTGVRKAVIGACILTGFSMAGFLLVREELVGSELLGLTVSENLLRYYYYMLGVLLGMFAITMMIAMKVLVSRWFQRKQGIAVGIVLAGSSVAGAIVPELARLITEALSWQWAFALMSLGIWVIALPLFVWKGREDPSDLGYELDQKAPEAKIAQMIQAHPALSQSLKQIMKGRNFWFIIIGLFLIGAVDQGLIQHTALYLERDLEFSKAVAARALAFTFLIGIAAKIGFGWIYDRLSIRGIMLCYVLLAVAVLLAFPISGLFTVSLFVIVRGVGHGGLILDSPILAKHCYGPKRLSLLIGIFTSILTLGYAFGIWLLGYLYDRHGDYTLGFISLIVMALVATLLLFWVTPTFWILMREKISDHNARQAKEPVSAK